MNPERDDPILDACLEEVLGGRTPPDLTARIAHAWRAQGGQVAAWESYFYSNGAAPPVQGATPPGGLPIPTALPASCAIPTAPAWGHPAAPLPIAPSNGQVPPTAIPTAQPVVPTAYPVYAAAPPVAAPPIAEPPVLPPVVAKEAAPLVQPVRPVLTPAESGSLGPMQWIVAASVLIAAGLIGYVAWRAANPEVDGGNVPLVIAPATDSGSKTPGTIPSPGPKTIVVTPGGTAPAENPFDFKPPFATPDTPGGTEALAAPRVAPRPDAEIVTLVNASIRDGWADARVVATRPASDEEWCRRTFNRILGRAPSAAEVQAFAAANSPDKRAALVDRLLTAPEHAAELARYWGEFWTAVLVGPEASAGNRSLADRGALRGYLEQAIRDNRPFDRVAAELIAATGSNQPGAADYNAAVNFQLANLAASSDRGVLATSRTARVFLGMQLQCAQCHQHPLNDWSQDHFWQLNGFFRQMSVMRSPEGSTLANVDFAGDGPPDVVDGMVYYEDSAHRMRAVTPRFLGGAEIPAAASLNEVDRRAELSKLVVGSALFDRAMINRVWAHFFGVGFTNPVDDMGPHNPPSNPALLQRLAEQWAAHGHDHRALLKWIALSEAFSLSSEVGPGNEADDPDAGRAPLFARFYVRPPAAAKVQDALVAVAKAVQDGGGAGVQGRRIWQGRVIEGMRDGEQEGIVGGAQSREILSGGVTRRALSPDQQSLVRRIAVSNLSAADKIEHFFQYALGRSATAAESRAAQALLEAHRMDEASAWENLWWALLGTAEFER